VSGAGHRAILVLVGAASVAAPQLLYVIGMAAAASLGTGAPTTFSYGFLGTQVFVSVLAGSVSIVAAAPIAANWDRDPASLDGPIGRGFRLAILVLVPAVAAVALIGADVASPLLSGFGSSDLNAVLHAFLSLTPSILAAQATAIPLVALYALQRHTQIAGLAVGVAILQAGLAAGAVAVGGIVALGLATSMSSLAFAGGLYAILYGHLAIRQGWQRVVDLARVGVPAAACFGAPAILGARGPLALAIGLVLFGVTTVFTGLPTDARPPDRDSRRPFGARPRQ
jgi:peptidoglycan biosynthesis protein MviN/MurJ (putative lipid II flippase)